MAFVLVVDDDPEVLDGICAVLASGGHAVERADGGLAALKILDKRKQLDLLLTDVMMPGLHGFALARMAVMRFPKIKVLYYTGFCEVDDGPRYGKMLRKPLPADDLRREVTEALASSPHEPQRSDGNGPE